MPITVPAATSDVPPPGPGDEQAAAAERSAEARLARVHLRGGLLTLARATLEGMAGAGTLDRDALADAAPGAVGRGRVVQRGLQPVEDRQRIGQAVRELLLLRHERCKLHMLRSRHFRGMAGAMWIGALGTVLCLPPLLRRLGIALSVSHAAEVVQRSRLAELVAEAAEVVRWAKFAPEGTRGVDAANPDNPYLTVPVAQYIAEANRETFVVIQVEDAGALERADEIAAVDGVDVLFVGPVSRSGLAQERESLQSLADRTVARSQRGFELRRKPVALCDNRRDVIFEH